MANDRVPPNDLEAETQVLSALLCAHSSLAEASGLDTGLDTAKCLLRPEHWYSDTHRRIFEAVMALEAESRAVDESSVVAWLDDRGKLQAAGGRSYLRQLIESVPATVYIDDCARRIRDKWRLRQVIASCQRIAAEGYGPVEDAGVFVDRAEQALSEISSEREARQPMSIRDVIRDRFSSLQTRVQAGTEAMIRTGIRTVDEAVIGFQAPDLVCVAARPGRGKTAFAINNIVMDSAQRGIGVGVFSLEMSREQLIDRAICSAALVDSRKIPTNKLENSEWARMTREAARISKLPIIIDDQPAIHLSVLRSKVRRMSTELRREGAPLGMVVVDYLQLMGTTPGKETRDQKVGENSRGLKALAKELEIVVVMLAQLNRDVEKRGKSARPQLSDLRECGSIEADCDVVIFLHSPQEPDGKAEIIAEKHRQFGQSKVDVAWRPVFTRFDELDPGWNGPDQHNERGGKW